MSVAFRRESDEEHKEPTFERPIPPGPNLVTPAGRDAIAARAAELEAVVAAEHDEAALASLRRDLRYWHTRLTTAEVVAAPTEGETGIGSTITFRLDGETRTLRIVGGDEADPTAGSIAFHAPLARTLMGSMAGDMIDFAGRVEAVEVLSVSP